MCRHRAENHAFCTRSGPLPRHIPGPRGAPASPADVITPSAPSSPSNLPCPARSPTVTILHRMGSDALTRHLTYLETRRLSPETIRQRRQRVRDLLAAVGTDDPA